MARHDPTPAPDRVGPPAADLEPSPRVRTVHRTLVVLILAAAVLQTARLVLGPDAAAVPPGMTAATVAFTWALHGVVAWSTARWSNTGRIAGAFVAGAHILAALLGTVSMFAFPPQDWALHVILAALLIAVDAAWLVCAFHPPLAAVFRDRARAARSRARADRPGGR